MSATWAREVRAPALAWVSVDSGLPGVQTSPALVSFPVAVIAYPDKSNLRKRGLFSSQFQVIVPGGEDSWGSRELVTLYLQPSSGESSECWLASVYGVQLLFSTLFSPGSQKGNSPAHSRRVFPPQS